MVQVDAVHDARVVVRNPVLVVIIVGIWLQRIRQQGAAVERRAQSSGNGAHFDVGPEDERAGAAAEDVRRGWLAKRSAVAGEVERAVRDGALHNAPLTLGVHREGLARIRGVDLVDVGLEVTIEEIVVEHNAVVWAESSQVLAIGGLNKLVPACAVLGGLGLKSVADGLQAVGGHSGDMLGCAGGIGEGQGDW